MDRRRFLKFGTAGVTGGALSSLGTWFYGTRLETEWLELERVMVPIKGLDTGLEGFKIALLSDFHLYPHTRLEFLQRAIDQANEIQADLVALTGDFVQKDAEAIYDLAPALARLNAKYGIFSVLGNHDHWKGASLVREELDRNGLNVLDNQGLSLPHPSGQVFLAGVDDAWAGNPDPAKALDRHRGESLTILLSHEPDPADEYQKDPRITLQLSGHSHGGQVRFPLAGSPFLPPWGKKYDLGLYQVGDMWLYTNRGLGVTVPIRFNCRPEVTEITLTASS